MTAPGSVRAAATALACVAWVAVPAAPARAAGAGTYSFPAGRFEAADPFIAGHSRTLRVVQR